MSRAIQPFGALLVLDARGVLVRRSDNAGALLRMAQVISNLLSNARHHGEVGTPIKVSLRIQDESAYLAVTNAGGPIPPQTRAQIFQPFKIESLQERRNRSGLGLGLHIVNEIVKRRGAHRDRSGRLRHLPRRLPDALRPLKQRGTLAGQQCEARVWFRIKIDERVSIWAALIRRGYRAQSDGHYMSIPARGDTMHPPLNIAAILACSDFLGLAKAWSGHRKTAGRGRSEAPSTALPCDRHAKHFAAAVFGWGKWQGPSVGVDLGDLLEDESVRDGAPAGRRSREHA